MIFYLFGWQELPVPQWLQWLQSPPQQDFPCFLSLIIFRIIPVTIPINAADTNSVPALEKIHAIIE